MRFILQGFSKYLQLAKHRAVLGSILMQQWPAWYTSVSQSGSQKGFQTWIFQSWSLKLNKLCQKLLSFCQDSRASERGSLVESSFPSVSWVPSVLDAVRTKRHLSRYVSSAGTQPAVFGVRTGTTEKQRLLLKAAVSTPGAIWRKQVIHALLHTGAAYPQPKRQESCYHLLF